MPKPKRLKRYRINFVEKGSGSSVITACCMDQAQQKFNNQDVDTEYINHTEYEIQDIKEESKST